MKHNLTYGDRCIITRNENEIKVRQIRVLNELKEIKELRKQNREILGRD